ncbi:MAG: helicase-related protein [Pseudomonadales bacterium]
MVDRERQTRAVDEAIQDNNWYQVLVFTRTNTVRTASPNNWTAGISAMAIHGNKSQGKRTKAQDTTLVAVVLVATDIAARGIDISDTPCH